MTRFHRRPFVRQLAIAAVALSGAIGCGSQATFTLQHTDGSQRDWAVPDRQTVGAGTASLGPFSGNVDRALYRMDLDRAAYLFSGDLAAGIEPPASFLALPEFDDSGLDRFEQLDVDVTGSWTSFRIYDSGECSLLVALGTSSLPGVIPAFAPTLAATLDSQFRQCARAPTERYARTAPLTVTPLLRARGGIDGPRRETDRYRVSTLYTAPSQGGCAPVNLEVAFDMGLRVDAAGNVVGVADEIVVEVQEFCIAEARIENSATTRISGRVPGAITAAFRAGLTLAPSVFGIPAVACASDADCAGAYSELGPGATCNTAVDECHVRLVPDRLNLRPEGLELVLFEDRTDPQVGFLSAPRGPFLEAFVCGPDRFNDMLIATSLTPGTLAGASVPTGTPPACPP